MCPNPAVKLEWMQRLNETIDNLKASENSIRVSQSMTGPLHVARSSLSYHQVPGKGDISGCTVKLSKVGGSDSMEGLDHQKKHRPSNAMIDPRHEDNSDILSMKSFNSYSVYDEDDKMSIKSTKSGKGSSSHHKHSKKSSSKK